MIPSGLRIQVRREPHRAWRIVQRRARQDISFLEMVRAGLDVEDRAGARRVDPVRRYAEVVAVDPVCLQPAGCLVGPVLAVLAVLEPRPAAEEPVLFRMLVIEAI